MDKKLDLNEQASEILRIAEKHGVEQNFLFITNFRSYRVLLGVLNELELKIKEEGTIVTKEYVKGRKNVYINPALHEYNRTVDTATKVSNHLIRIIKTMREENYEEEDPLLEILGIRKPAENDKDTSKKI
jgi:hypothetical protein